MLALEMFFVGPPSDKTMLTISMFTKGLNYNQSIDNITVVWV